MADLVIVKEEVSPVTVILQHTVPSSVAIDAGEAVYIVAASGKAGLAEEDGVAPVNGPVGVSVKTADPADTSMTYVQKGILDVGDALAGMAFSDTVWLSVNPGKLADTAGANSVVAGIVIPGWGNTTADKLLQLDL